MAKEVIDILPPEKIEKKKPSFPETIEIKEEPVEPKKKVLVPKSEVFKPSLPSFRGIVTKKKSLFFIGALVLLFVLAFIILPKVEIEIQPVSEIITFDTDVNFDQSLKTANFSSALLPGEILNIEKELIEEFSASGKTMEEKKAEGIIRIYNAYSTDSQILVATTRFVSTEGKLFRSVERVTIPGGHYEGGKLVPGFLDIQVRADQPGEDYNIGPSTFSIPGFAGTARYTYFYGKSFQSMTGGLSKEVSRVTQGDLDLAKNTLIEKAKKECQAELGRKISPELILPEEAQKIEIVETSSSAKTNEITEKFTFRVKAQLLALTLKRKDLEDFTKQFISLQTTRARAEAEDEGSSSTGLDKKLYEQSLEIDYLIKSLNWESGKGTLSLKITAKIYSDIDTANLKRALSGKSISETKFYLESHSQIVKAQVHFWPFWVKSVPQDEGKIKIELRVD